MKIRLFSIRFLDLGLGGCNGKKKIRLFFIIEVIIQYMNSGGGANHFLYAFQGGVNHFFVYISGGANQFLHVFQGGARRFLTIIFNVWSHTCPITIASSLNLNRHLNLHLRL